MPAGGQASDHGAGAAAVVEGKGKGKEGRARGAKGLARESLGQKAETFLNMAHKQFIQMTRYPVSFFTSFGQVFLIFLIFFFGFTVFLAEPAQEWPADGAMAAPSGDVWLARNSTHAIVAVESNATETVFVLWSGNISGSAAWDPETGNLTAVGDAPAHASGDRFIEMAFPLSWARNGTLSLAVFSSGMAFPSGANETDAATWLAVDVGALDEAPGFSAVDGRMGEEEDDSGDLGSMVILGLIMFLFLSETLWNIGMSIRDEQYQGTLESLYLTPASKFTNMISRVAPMLTWNGLMAAFVLAFMYFLVGGIPLANPHIALLVLVFTIPGTLGVGFIFAALALRLKESVELLANISQFGLMLLTGMMFPFGVLPSWVVDFGSRLIPLSYSVDAFRCALLDRTPELAPMWVELVVVVAFGVIMPVVGYAVFHWQEHEARKKGSLSEY